MEIREVEKMTCPACGSNSCRRYREDGEPGDIPQLGPWQCDDCPWRESFAEQVERELGSE